MFNLVWHAAKIFILSGSQQTTTQPYNYTTCVKHHTLLSDVDIWHKAIDSIRLNIYIYNLAETDPLSFILVVIYSHYPYNPPSPTNFETDKI